MNSRNAGLPNSQRRALFLGALGSIASIATSSAVHGQEKYPAKPVRVIVPFTPGGNADSTARIFGETLSRFLGQPFVIDNRGGAGGMIGTSAVVSAEADGYTLLCATPGPILSAWQLAGKAASYSLSDMRPVAMLTLVPNVLVVNETSSVKSIKDLAAVVERRPKDLRCGHPGNGTTGHVNILQLQKALKADFVIAGYKGSGPAVQDLIGGQLDVVATDLPAAQQLIKAGRLRAIATVGRQRALALPELPTMSEARLPDVDATNFTALMGPRNMPLEAVKRIAEAVSTAIDTEALRNKIADIGTIATRMSGQELDRFLAREAGTYTSLIQSGLLRPE